MATDNKTVGRKAGPGAIQCGADRYAEFAKIWNSANESSETLTITKSKTDEKGKVTQTTSQVKGRMVTIIKALRAAGIADSNTDQSQVRAFATKVRNAGIDLTQYAVRLDRKIAVRAWMTSNSPSEAFTKAVKMGLFGKEVEFEDEADRKNKLQSFRACIAQMKKQKVPLKEMGRQRASKIKDSVFIEAWNSSETVAEVKDKLVAQGVIKEDFKLSSLRSKYKTLVKAGVELKEIKKSGSQINDLAKLARMLAENPDAEFADEDDDDDDDEEVDDDDDEDAEVTDDDADTDDGDEVDSYLDE